MIFHKRRFRRGNARRPVPLLDSPVRSISLAALIILCVGSLTLANGVDTDGFLRDFEQKRGEINTYTARFVQKKILTLFEETKISNGALYYRAPQQMTWKYSRPDKTQMRINRDSVSFYFPELEQIEVYPLDKGGGASSFFFAFEASADELKENFEISIGAAGEDLHRVDLSPKSGPLAQQLRGITLWLGKTDYMPRKILIRDISGDTTEIALSEIRVNEPIADDEIEFDAPEGTEIIQMRSGAF